MPSLANAYLGVIIPTDTRGGRLDSKRVCTQGSLEEGVEMDLT